MPKSEEKLLNNGDYNQTSQHEYHFTGWFEPLKEIKMPFLLAFYSLEIEGTLQALRSLILFAPHGEMAEWLKAPVLKTGDG